MFLANSLLVRQTALDVPWVGKCTGENNGSTIDSIVLANVVRGRSSPRTTKNADWLVRRLEVMSANWMGYSIFNPVLICAWGMEGKFQG